MSRARRSCRAVDVVQCNHIGELRTHTQRVERSILDSLRATGCPPSRAQDPACSTELADGVTLSLLASAERVHELAPAGCDLLPLPSLRFRETSRRLLQTCWRLGNRHGSSRLTLVLPSGVILGGCHKPETTRSSQGDSVFRQRRPQTVRKLSTPLVIRMTVSTAVWEGSLRDQPSHDDAFRHAAQGHRAADCGMQ